MVQPNEWEPPNPAVPIHVDICVFKDGQHTRMSQHCPHFNEEDETGPIINPSWTVQSNNG